MAQGDTAAHCKAHFRNEAGETLAPSISHSFRPPPVPPSSELLFHLPIHHTLPVHMPGSGVWVLPFHVCHSNFWVSLSHETGPHAQAAQPETSCFTSPSLCFSICEMGPSLTCRLIRRIQGDQLYKMPSARPGALPMFSTGPSPSCLISTCTVVKHADSGATLLGSKTSSAIY